MVRDRKSEGFTLIELLLVLAIIGVISAIAVPAIFGMREDSKNKSLLSNAANIRAVVAAALDSLAFPDGERPTDLAGKAKISEVLSVLALRKDIALSRNPFDPTKPAYRFNGDAISIGEVGLNGGVSAETGIPMVRVTVGLSVKGSFTIKDARSIEAPGVPL